ncbi:hypothetical protein OAX78_00210 [Planctomycetota bacterium]|nr:hypothetical protein [Planctomycetota bacterium]
MRVSCGGLILGALLFAPGSAWACSCVPPPPVLQAKQDAAAVFEGRVIDVAVDEANWRTVATLEVLAVWKGGVEIETAVVTGMGGGDCGFGFVEGDVYVVYAHATAEGALSTNICTRSRPTERAETLALGASYAPRPNSAPPIRAVLDDKAKTGWLIAALLGGSALVSAVLVWAGRAKPVDDSE